MFHSAGHVSHARVRSLSCEGPLVCVSASEMPGRRPSSSHTSSFVHPLRCGAVGGAAFPAPCLPAGGASGEENKNWYPIWPPMFSHWDIKWILSSA